MDMNDKPTVYRKHDYVLLSTISDNVMMPPAAALQLANELASAANGLVVKRSDWTEAKRPPPGERWDVIVPVLNLTVDRIRIFASLSIEDDPPNEWSWMVEVEYLFQSAWVKALRVTSHDCFPEEEAIERCSRAAEHLFAVAKLSLEGQS